MPKIVDHSAFRKELLDQVTPLFLQYGYEAVTTRQIARHLSISTGKLYHYFANKEALFEALVLHWQDQDIQAVRECAREFPSRSDKIQQVLRCMQEDKEKILTSIQLIMQYCQLQRQKHVSLHDFWDGFHQRWHQVILDVFQFESSFACQMFGNVVDSLFMNWLSDCQCPDYDHFVERLGYWLPLIDDGEAKRRSTCGQPEPDPAEPTSSTASP